MYRIDLTAEAEADLVEIWLYTHEQWGANQAEIYSQKLDTGIKRLAAGSLQGKRVLGMRQAVFSYHCEHHYIIYLLTGDCMLLIAVLGERMDLPNRIRDRL